MLLPFATDAAEGAEKKYINQYFINQFGRPNLPAHDGDEFVCATSQNIPSVISNLCMCSCSYRSRQAVGFLFPHLSLHPLTICEWLWDAHWAWPTILCLFVRVWQIHTFVPCRAESDDAKGDDEGYFQRLHGINTDIVSELGWLTGSLWDCCGGDDTWWPLSKGIISLSWSHKSPCGGFEFKCILELNIQIPLNPLKQVKDSIRCWVELVLDQKGSIALIIKSLGALSLISQVGSI